MKTGRGKSIWQTRTLRYTLIVVSAIAGVLLFLLASASSNSPLFERHYPILLGLNATFTVAMVLLVGVLVQRLVRHYRSGAFGARLMARFALSFALMGVIPGALIYLVSVQFLSRSIESWFNVRVDTALESGLALGRATLDTMLGELQTQARSIALELSDAPDGQQAIVLNRRRQQGAIQQATLFSASGRMLASSGTISEADGGYGMLVPGQPPANVLRQLRATGSYSAIESPLVEIEGARPALRMRVIALVPDASLSFGVPESRYVQLLQDVPQEMAINAEAVQAGVRDYQALSLSRTGLRKIYTVTLTLALLLSVFAALAVAYLLASWLTAPLLLLAEGTKAVAGGDYRPMREIDTKDELGTLTQSFNAMTRQLAEARFAVERNRLQLENAKAYLESVLGNLSAGVLVFDEHFRLTTANHGAERILGMSFAGEIGKPLGEIAGLGRLAAMIEAAFDEQSEQSADWQKQVELERLPLTSDPSAAPTDKEADTDPLALHARGSRCPVGDGQGYLVVLDDVSDVVSAQRSIAWGEVARRLAHEIKNPLTPIQLAAERLQMKLSDKLPPGEASVLERGVATIVNQVTAMKHMVDDFRDYSSSPPESLPALDLNVLVTEVLALYGVGLHEQASAIELQLAPALPLIYGDATRLRQIIHNLVQNAQDATHGQEDSGIRIVTERVEVRPGGQARNERAALVRLTVSDNGSGFPAKILARAFEPYVTTKPRGTGLGLAVVKKIAEEHGARVELRNRDGGGASVSILFTKVANPHLQVA